jgi:hypothetical protein
MIVEWIDEAHSTKTCRVVDMSSLPFRADAAFGVWAVARGSTET